MQLRLIPASNWPHFIHVLSILCWAPSGKSMRCFMNLPLSVTQFGCIVGLRASAGVGWSFEYIWCDTQWKSQMYWKILNQIWIVASGRVCVMGVLWPGQLPMQPFTVRRNTAHSTIATIPDNRCRTRNKLSHSKHSYKCLKHFCRWLRCEGRTK